MPRRPKFIVKRKGSWVLDTRINGRRIRKTLGKIGEVEYLDAQELGMSLLEKERRKQHAHTKDASVADFGDRWLEGWVRLQRNSKGYSLAVQRLRDHIKPVIGQALLREVGQAELREISASLVGKGKAPRTVKWILGDIRCMLRYAKDLGIIDSVPSFRTVMPRIAQKQPNPIGEEDLNLIYEELRSRPHHVFPVMLAHLTGLRYSEVRRLRWRDVIWDPDAHLVLGETKSGKVRRVPLFPETVRLLREESTRDGCIRGQSEPVSPYRALDAGHIYRSSSRRITKKLGREFKWNFHRLRDTFACSFLDVGGTVGELQVILGHSTIQMTERYARLSEKAVFRAVKGLTLTSGHESGQTGNSKLRQEARG